MVMAGRRASSTIPVSDDRLRNLAEAATWLGMGKSTLRQKLYEGLGPVAIKLPGSDRWRFRPRDLDNYVCNGEISPEKLASAPPVAARAAMTEDTEAPRKPHKPKLESASTRSSN
jgi:hypothetical protein